jgi:hypothetical protein
MQGLLCDLGVSIHVLGVVIVHHVTFAFCYKTTTVMDDVSLLYFGLRNANEIAFAKELFKAAYHALSGAMYCALDLQDGFKMKEIERLAREQFQIVKEFFPRSYPSNEPTEVGLYASLVEIAETRGALLRNMPPFS